MNNPVIGITGTSGFVGRALEDHFKASGHRVVSFSRSHFKEYNSDDIYYSITAGIDESFLKEVDVLIHCAVDLNDKNPPETNVNVAGAKKLFDTAKKASVKKIVFFSSLAADPAAQSAYLQSKFAIEKMLSSTDVVLKPGMIIGDGGLFKQLFQFAVTKRLVPLIDGGKQPIQHISIHEVVLAVENCILWDLRGTFILGSEKPVTYKTFFKQIAKASKKKLFFIPLSTGALRSIASLSKKLRFKAPVNEDNLGGLRSMKFVSPNNDLVKLGITIKPLSETLTSYFLSRSNQQ
jgi:nucleoside-diphosphate-sugar epimerase